MKIGDDTISTDKAIFDANLKSEWYLKSGTFVIQIIKKDNTNNWKFLSRKFNNSKYSNSLSLIKYLK